MTQQQIEHVPYQKVVFKNEAHSKMLKGASVLADAVTSTMGPSGHNVIIDYGEGGSPLITKDGVTVAKSICLSDKLESIGAELIKEVASKTNEIAGDGTTTATALAYGMLSKGIQMVSTGRSAIHLKKGMDKATEIITQFLAENCLSVSGRQDIINVGTISANGDRELGELICEAIEKVGRDGIITIEPAKSVHTTLDVVDGMRIESGFSSPFFITNNDKANCEFTNPLVLITSNKISSIGDIVPAMEIAMKSSRPLLIVADEVEGEALHTLIVNKTKGVIRACAIKAPFYGEHRAEVLSDLAVVVGAEVIGATSATSLNKIDRSQLGSCSRIVATRSSCTFVGESSNEERLAKINERAEDLRSVISDSSLDANQVTRYRSRLARLSGGIAVIRVGGSTEVEIKEKKDRIEDAVNATTAAVQEGIIAGGGAALFYASQYLREIIKNKDPLTIPELDLLSENQVDDFLDGMNVVASACEAPLRIIVRNTGVSDDVVISNIVNIKPKASTNTMVTEGNQTINFKLPNEFVEAAGIKKTFVIKDGYDARTGIYTDLIEAGIIDPVKVTKHALIHASSVVGLMLTCNAVIVDEE